MQVFAYDRRTGKIAKRSVLTAEGTPDAELQFETYEFDSIGREIRHTTPWNATTTTFYEGFLVVSTDVFQKHTVTKIDALGRPVLVTDAKNGKTRYTYGPFNTLHTVTDPGNAATKWTRDALGRVRQIDEPDRGTTSYKHNGFGDLIESTDALGRVVTIDVDELGRVETRTDKLGAHVSTTTWKWDTAPNGIGRLHEVTSPDAIQSISYTAHGQLESEMLTVVGDSFAATFDYDERGRVKSVDYPQPLGEEPFGVMYEHDEHGFVIGVHEKNTHEAFWTLKEVDNAGRIRKERFGNDVETTRSYDNDKQTLEGISTTFGGTKIQDLSYAWNERLNLKSRTDALQPQNKTEMFRYDELDRVTCAHFGAVESASAPCETSYSYQANGNLKTKSDVGMYSYADPKHPHAVTHVPGETFGYDEVGNQITRPGGISVTYTPFDLPKTITKGGKTTTFGYDGDQQRIRKSSATSETLYFGDIFEQVTTSAGGVEHRYYVHSPERAIAVVTRGGAKPGTRFLHVDHLGSVDVVTKEDGSIDERRSYDAFGARRNPEWGGPSIPLTNRTTRGFTGHEEDDEFGLVNMKGRIMDPRLGRFTTPDPVIANIWNGQSLNKYSYVGNNPLAFVDPTGFVPDAPSTTLPGNFCCIEKTVKVDYPTTVEDDFIITNHAANIGAYVAPVDVGTTGSGGYGLPQETIDPEEATRSLTGLAEFVGGLWLGIGEGLVPFGAVGHSIADEFGLSRNKSEEARIGLAIGQIAGGLAATIGGIGGEVVGGAASLTGFGTAPGVLVVAVSTAAVVGGWGNVAAGIHGLAKEMTGGGGTRGPPSSTTAPKNDYHGNDLRTTKPAHGYTLRDRNTHEIVKYGETTMGKQRYTQSFYEKHNVDIFFEAKGTKAEMHQWQHEKILEYKASHNGERPLLNRSDW